MQGIGERRPGRVEDRGMEEASGPRWRRMAALALPGIETDVVMIAAGRNKCRARAHTLRQLEAEHAAIEAERAVEVGDLQVHMPDPRASDDWWILRHGGSPVGSFLSRKKRGARVHSAAKRMVSGNAPHVSSDTCPS